MTEYVQWGSVPKSGGNGEKSEYLKLKSGNTYKIRPIFDPVKFLYRKYIKQYRPSPRNDTYWFRQLLPRVSGV